METAALCKPIQRSADLLRIPGTWVLTGLGKLLAVLGSFPTVPHSLYDCFTHIFLEVFRVPIDRSYIDSKRPPDTS